MATSSISTNFDLTKKSSAKSFVRALSASPVKVEAKSQDRIVMLTKQEALSILKKKNKCR